MSFDDKPDRFIFVNAPTIINAGPRDARRQLRSQLMRRVYFKKCQVPSSYLADLIDQIAEKQVDSNQLTPCRCDVSSSSSAPSLTQARRRTSRAGTNAYQAYASNTFSRPASHPSPPSLGQGTFSVNACEAASGVLSGQARFSLALPTLKGSRGIRLGQREDHTLVIRCKQSQAE